MSFNPNWPRWIFASVSKHFADKMVTASLPLFIEGQWRDTSSLPDFVEMRVDGPRTMEVSKDCWLFKLEINCIVQSVMNDTSYHRIHQNVGEVAASYSRSIEVTKKGDGPLDDGSHVGCLQLLHSRERRDSLEIHHFQQIDPDKQLMQASVEGHYRMLLNV